MNRRTLWKGRAHRYAACPELPFVCSLRHQAAELADTEYTAGVPALLLKIVLLRPRVVCFVGKQIWESFIKAAAPRPTGSRKNTPSAEREVHTEVVNASVAGPGNSVAQVTATRKKSVTKKRPAKPPLAFDLQPYKVVHPDRMSLSRLDSAALTPSCSQRAGARNAVLRRGEHVRARCGLPGASTAHRTG